MNRRLFIIILLLLLQFIFQLFFKIIEYDLAFNLTTIVIMLLLVTLGIVDYFCNDFSKWLDNKHKRW